jgi:hypothetical protein
LQPNHRWPWSSAYRELGEGNPDPIMGGYGGGDLVLSDMQTASATREMVSKLDQLIDKQPRTELLPAILAAQPEQPLSPAPSAS